MSKISKVPNMTSEIAVQILTKTLEELQREENSQKLKEARDNVGNEMLKVMQYVFPVVMQVQIDVIKEFGFPEGKDGLMKFALMIRNLEREDPEVARLHSLIRSFFLPPINTTNEQIEPTNSN